MKEDTISLIQQFKIIQNSGWIPSMRKGPGGCGYTFEKLIGKNENNFEIPDFGTIEIKTRFSKTNTPISLFTASPDGDIVYPIETLQHEYGYPDKEYPQFKVLNIEVFATKYTVLGVDKLFKLEVDRNNEVVRLNAIYKGKNESYITWSFYILEKKLQSKLEYIALILADYNYIKGKSYYKYNSISFYQLRGFKTFISLIEQGKISIKFKIGVFKSGKRFGKRHDRGTAFSIYMQDFDSLYKKINIEEFC